jgi:hypothetical protein
MRLILVAAVSAALALSLSACGTVNGGYADFAKQVVTDPKCGHDDTVLGSIGGLSGGNLQVSLARHCPAPVAPTTPGQPSSPPAPQATGAPASTPPSDPSPAGR